ncbi:HD domain-containing protein [Micromonospora sp. NPDC050187]|uniref:HD domain-containing protein n=1 Tax=Micromonospora sp. NPDC050187 TaxID=3364277 RepID=UPI0037B85DD4
MRIGIIGSGMRIPTDRQIRALHKRFAPTLDAFDLVYTHCRIVCELAEQLLASRKHDLDVELVRAGSLVHDIGVYRLYDSSGKLEQRDYVRHGLLGHELLRDLGFQESLCRFCSCHTGMGLSREDVVRQRLPLPVNDYLAESDEERLVMYADKFHSKTTPPTFISAATYVSGVRQFGRDKVDRFADLMEQFGEPDLSSLASGYGHAIV